MVMGHILAKSLINYSIGVKTEQTQICAHSIYVGVGFTLDVKEESYADMRNC